MRLDPMENYESADTKHKQVLYLYHVMNLAKENIAVITGYAVSTVSRYISKYSHLLEEAKNLFEKGIEKTREVVRKITNAPLPAISAECEIPADGVETAYVVEFYDKNQNFTYTKIGYSARTAQRMNDHAKRSKYGTAFVKVLRCYTFDDKEQAMTMENAMRKHFKAKNNSADYVRNDRFSEQRATDEDFKIFEEKAKMILDNF